MKTCPTCKKTQNTGEMNTEGKVKSQRNSVRPKRYWEKDVEDWIGAVFGEWGEQQKSGGCIEDPRRQQRPETDKRKRES